MTRSERLWCAAAFTVIAAWNLLRWHTAERIALDDAWISFRYARHLIEGAGFVYNVEDGPLEGFTNLAWVLLTALAMKLGAAPLLFTRTLGLVSHLAVVAFILARGFRGKAVARGAAVVLAAIPGVTHGLLGLAGSGLETSFAALLIVLLAECLDRSDLLPAALVSVLLCATRPDGALFVGAFVLVLFTVSRGRALRIGALVALGFLGLVAFRWFTFHALVPNTYFAKSAHLAQWAAGWAYWGGFAQSEPGVVLLALALPFTWKQPSTRFVALCLGLYVIYVAKVGGDFMEYRFAFEVIPLLAWGLSRAAGERPRLTLGIAVSALALAALPPRMENAFGMNTIDEMNELVEDGLEIGAKLREVLPPDTRISTALAGTLPYEFGGFTVDEWGLNDAAIAHQPDVPITFRGHVKLASNEYLKSRGVNLRLAHPRQCRCDTGCPGDWPQVYVRLDELRCVQTRYLVPTPRLTRLFCTDPRFIVTHVDCAD